MTRQYLVQVMSPLGTVKTFTVQALSQDHAENIATKKWQSVIEVWH